MIIILILMSLSSVGFIRNSSYDLFQIFHRLSVIFVILLFLHPSSHVLKEQSNVDRHNPELCYDKMISSSSVDLLNEINSTTTTTTRVIFQQNYSPPNLIAARTRAPPRGNVTQLDTNKNLPAASEQGENHPNKHLHDHYDDHDDDDDNVEGRQFDSSATRRQYYYNNNATPEQNKPNVVNNNNNHKITTTTTTTRDLSNNNNNDNINTKKGNQNGTTIIQEPAKLIVSPSPMGNSGNNNNNNDYNSTTAGYYYNYLQQLHQNNNNKTAARIKETAVISNDPVRTDTYDDGDHHDVDGLSSPVGGSSNSNSSSNRSGLSSCLDPRPLFVAQSSICWYVLSVGLSCYLVDLILRKSRRSKSSIQLLDARLDCEGNLIELILNSNHKRFALWLPGQFVYLNCPQIATFEWHPFTISSMDNRSGQFTLHIKTGGDWTRKLRKKLECLQEQQLSIQFTSSNNNQKQQQQQHDLDQKHGSHLALSKIKEPETREIFFKSSNPLRPHYVLPDFDCYNKTGKLQVECTKVICMRNDDESQQQQHCYDNNGCDNSCIGIDLSNHNNNDDNSDNSSHVHQQEQPYSISHKFINNNDTTIIGPGGGSLELYIDGPFHSPFERLLEQQVSVCIANGVGWTAFSSVFQCLTRNFLISSDEELDRPMAAAASSWWSQWHNFARYTATNNSIICNGNDRAKTEINHQNSSMTASKNLKKLSDTKLHLMIIVTSIEQLKPFYELALKYFNRIQNECQISVSDQLNPVREITAFLTRSTKDDHNVKEFCQQENLSISHENNIVRVNDLFHIHFGKPKFGFYFSDLSAIYTNYKKISVYCCGSYQVKKDIREICLNFNKANRRQVKMGDKTLGPIYSYHEENF